MTQAAATTGSKQISSLTSPEQSSAPYNLSTVKDKTRDNSLDFTMQHNNIILSQGVIESSSTRQSQISP